MMYNGIVAKLLSNRATDSCIGGSGHGVADGSRVAR